jgi:hypothetical protein
MLPIQATRKGDRTAWIICQIYVGRKAALLRILVRKTTDEVIRQRTIERLSQLKGFRKPRKSSTGRSVGVYRQRIEQWKPGHEPDAERMTAIVAQRLEQFERHLDPVSNALLPIFEEWKKSHA